jgi:cytidine deaminase
MNEIKITTIVAVYGTAEELPEAERYLPGRAMSALENAYAPYSGFRVGAAVLLANGAIEIGSNQENAAYPICLCAERVALAAASSRHPAVAPIAIAVRVRHHDKQIQHPAAPCGACRQALSEVEDRYKQPIAVIMQGEEGLIYRVENAKALLPLSFDGTYL